MKFFQFSAFVILLSLIACSKKTVSTIQIQDSQKRELSEAYIQEIEDWRDQRFESITSPYGWLSVVGLYWLAEGENRFGSSTNNQIIIPEASSYIGSITLDGNDLKFNSFGEAYVTSGDEVFKNGPIQSDENGKATYFDNQSFNFHVIKRGDKYGLRVKNTLARARYELKDIPEFELNADMIFDGIVVPTPIQDSIMINDVIGTEKMYKIEALLKFKADKRERSLLAIDGGKDHYFVIFKDFTTGNKTYGGGRFLYVKRPAEGSNEIILDFNKAHNPPCAFTDYATCPLPPLQNSLLFLVNAGEKTLKSH